MTTIACDGKILAADSIAVGCFPINSKKIWKLKDGDILAYSGETQKGMVVINWLNGDGNQPCVPLKDFTSILISKGKLFRFDDYLVAFEVDAPHAIGSGCDFAMGAMLAGANAVEAIKIAKKLNVWTLGKIQIVKVKLKRRK